MRVAEQGKTAAQPGSRDRPWELESTELSSNLIEGRSRNDLAGSLPDLGRVGGIARIRLRWNLWLDLHRDFFRVVSHIRAGSTMSRTSMPYSPQDSSGLQRSTYTWRARPIARAGRCRKNSAIRFPRYPPVLSSAWALCSPQRACAEPPVLPNQNRSEPVHPSLKRPRNGGPSSPTLCLFLGGLG